MRKLVFLTLLLSLSACVSHSGKGSNPSYDPSKPICLLTGKPPAEYGYKHLGKVKFVKGGYGSINDVILEIVHQARKLGADAIINYNGGQRFGFWPWQFVRPVVQGNAVKWNSPKDVDCEGMGGTYKIQLKGPLTTDV